jgi:hypothetical protein
MYNRPQTESEEMTWLTGRVEKKPSQRQQQYWLHWKTEDVYRWRTVIFFHLDVVESLGLALWQHSYYHSHS